MLHDVAQASLALAQRFFGVLPLGFGLLARRDVDGRAFVADDSSRFVANGARIF
jgi:hypothetical protein